MSQKNDESLSILAILKSRTIFEKIIQRFDLIKVYQAPNIDKALIALANNISGLIIGNSTTERSKNLISKNKNEIGGLSGRPLFVKSTICLRKMYSLTNGQIPLIGVGGVSSGNECYEKIKAGANLIQLYTALIFKGPAIVPKIKKELIDLIKTDGFKNIKDVVGKEV